LEINDTFIGTMNIHGTNTFRHNALRVRRISEANSRHEGGMAMASVLASAVFGALCGVSIAGAAAIGSFAIPEMLKRGYHKSLAVGPVTAAGALSLLIPPSIAFIVYGEVADESVGKLFLGGVVPGFVLALLMIVYIFVVCLFKPRYAPLPTEFMKT
jgi:C4-dicarboxylate transporter DctM subunit